MQVQQEALERGDLVVLPWVAESYDSLAHQQLEICRAAAADPAVTHVLKVGEPSSLPQGGANRRQGSSWRAA